MNFRVGQKVICIAATAHDQKWLTIGAIYTISDKGRFLSDDPAILYDVAEIATYAKHAWPAAYFRPLVEKKTDAGMAILKTILEDAENFKVKEEA